MAISLLTSGGFEDGGSGWTLTPSSLAAEIVEDAGVARTGDFSLRLKSFRLLFGDPFTLGMAQSPALSYWPGKLHTFTVYAKRETGGPGFMRIRGWESPSTVRGSSGTLAITSQWAAYTLTFTPTIADGYVTIEALSNGSSNFNMVADDVVVTLPEVTPMAYLGPELAVAAMLDMIQDNLAAELAKIVLERNDSLVFPATTIDAVFNRPADAFVGSVLQLEVFSESSGFPRVEADLSTWLASTPLVTTEVRLVVRLRIANRGSTALSPVDFSTMTNRYAAALVRLIRNDPQLANGGSALVDWAQPEDVRVSRTAISIDEDVSQYLDVVELDISVSLTESNANENISGGGTAPAYSGGLGLA